MTDSTDSVAAARFDEAYYRRFYENPGTRVATPEELRPLVEFVVAYLRYLGVPFRRVIDFGAGTGLWRDVLRSVVNDHAWSYVGVDISPTVCRRYGWVQGDVISYRPRKRYDLVVCSGVLHYLPEAEVGAAIANLAACCRGVVYLHIPTADDLERVLDRRVSDQSAHFRPGTFYRRHLTRHFLSAGGGLFAPRDTTLPFWELERAD